MKVAETKSVCAIAKDTPRAGYRLVETVVDSGAEESVAHRMFSQKQPRKRHVCPRRVASTKLRMALGFQIGASEKFVSTTMKAKSAVWDSRSPMLNAPIYWRHTWRQLEIG